MEVLGFSGELSLARPGEFVPAWVPTCVEVFVRVRAFHARFFVGFPESFVVDLGQMR